METVEEANKLRLKLGLAPLDLDNENSNTKDNGKTSPQITLQDDEELFKEDGVSIVHKAPKNWGHQKATVKLKEKIETQKQKRTVESRLLKVNKGLADSDSEEESALGWINRNRLLDTERKKAEEKNVELRKSKKTGHKVSKNDKQFDGYENKKNNLTAGLVVGHSKDSFVDGKETILVLQDKGVLDEDEDEVLINPNMIDNERHKKNVELRKSNKTGYKAYEDDEQFDKYGNYTKKNILDKYDNVLDGEEIKKQEKFRLDNTGGYDLDKEVQEAENKRKLLMANKKFESLDTAKPLLAREFYTDEEMISFRRPKKKRDTTKTRKRKVFKTTDILSELDPNDGLTEEERKIRASKLAARRNENIETTNEMETKSENLNNLEEGELEDDKTETKIKHRKKWKEVGGGIVDVNSLKNLAAKVNNKIDEESEEEDLVGGVDLTGVVLEDDAEDELNLALQRQRLSKQNKVVKKEIGAEQVRLLITSSKIDIKEEYMEEDDEHFDRANSKRQIVFDSTSEQYKSIGEIPTLGLAGNREVGVDYSTLDDEYDPNTNLETRKRYHDIDSEDEEALKEAKEKIEKKKKKKRAETEERGTWDNRVDEDNAIPSSSKNKVLNLCNSDEEDSDSDEYENVLGEEKDVTKGVAAMLKLAGVKGYLENSNSKNFGDGTLKHLESKRFSKVEQGRYDIEDKTLRKLERMGTTGRGPTMPFPEKCEYKPDVEVTYSDKKGRLMSSKEAFRVLSWKFHGKGPGKKQIEKHQAQLEKKERLKKMNSMDTPLGTLAKQRKKQEQLQTPYLILSGTGREIGAPLQKD